MEVLVKVEGLTVSGRDEAGRDALIVEGVSFEIARGEVMALIGESGSGKSTIALTLMAYTRPGCRIVGGRVEIGGADVAGLSARERARLRGGKVAYVAQSAAAAFNPAKRLMPQVVEGALYHGLLGRDEAERKAVGLFRSLALPEPETIGSRYPHQVSGGQLQRLMLAMALMTDPHVVILDEPTTALDVTTQIEVLVAFKKAVREQGTTALYVSHDLAVVAQMADRILVLRRGQTQEVGATGALIAAPVHEYTRSLLEAAEPAARIAAGASATPASAAPTGGPLLTVKGLSAGYGAVDRAGRPQFPVLADIDLHVRAGSSLGVIGESGSGKSTLARVVAGLLPAARGTIELGGRPLAASSAQRSLAELRDIQIVFQMADTALNPAHTVGRLIGRPLALFEGLSPSAQRPRVAELLDMVQLPAVLAERRPAELSGGQKQRVNLARALAASPKLILCDEVTSSLDTVVGAAILKLLADLRQRLGVAYLFISHDLSTVRAVCEEIVVLYAGCLVQHTPKAAIRARPMHPYADLLVSSIPELRLGWLDGVAGVRAGGYQPPRGAAASAGCPFAPRCALARPGTCDRLPPPAHTLSSGARILCHLSEAELAAAQGAATAA